jgi:CSLREA domain-containing protein
MRSVFGKVFCVDRRAAVFAVGLALTLALLVANPAHAKTFTVNSTEDFSDIDFGDGICDSLLDPLLNPCTLRAAIQEANAFAGADTIAFDIPGSGVKTISPNSALPAITRRVAMDGYTQPGSSPNTSSQGAINASPLIELDGTSAGSSSNGLVIGSNVSNTVIKGLVINRFGNNGIFGNPSSASTGIRVKGNFIGTNAAGTANLGNGNNGVAFIGSSNSTVGGTLPEDRNVISGNASSGVAMVAAPGTKVLGNLIGTAKNGTADLGNDSNGVSISGNNHTVGGTASGAANVIAHNGGDGVKINTGPNSGNRILSNSIRSNGELGIDLTGGIEDANGVTANDTKDPDTGANTLQNHPILTVIQTIGNQVTLTGTLNSRPEKKFTIQFFSSPQEDPSDSGEGKTFLGQKKVETNKKGNSSFTFTAVFPAGEFYMTATATGRGGTSEFSNSILEI